MNLDEVKKTLDKVFSECGRVIVGQEEMLKHIMTSVLTDSHALIEGYPGLAKTLTVSTLSRLMDLKFSRIQNTPDLMPSDILGTYILEESKGKREFKFQQGPIFANVILADELNRASPKTQSAYLESMQERQVTLGNSTFKLDKPFLVLATQNPIEQEGSLALDQPVFIDGELKNGYELLREMKDVGVVEQSKKCLYMLPDSYTLALGADGRLQKNKCLLYTLPYEGDLIAVKTKQGRCVTVSGNHPFLVNEKGKVSWKRAEELQEGDYLVSPAKISSSVEKTELINHHEALNLVSKKYKVVRFKEMVELRDKTCDFEKDKLKLLNGEDFTKLRIVSWLSIKRLAKKLGLNKAGYWQLVRFLRRNTNNEYIKNKLVDYFSRNKPRLDGKDYVESFSINSIKPFKVDEDVAAWLAFLQSDGTVRDTVIAAYQKNYPQELARFVKTTINKLGMKISYTKTTKRDGTRVVIQSKPLVDYLKFRFGIEHNKVPSWFISLPIKFVRSYLRTFISLESHFDIKTRRITFVQKNFNTVNTLRYMLLKDGINSWLKKDSGGIWGFRIQGRDLNRFIGKIGWVDARKIKRFRDEVPENFAIGTSSRVIPLPKDMIVKVCNLLGLNSFHAYKNRKRFLDMDWYFAYKACQQGREVVSIDLFKKLVRGFRKELKKRRGVNFAELMERDIREAAVLIGIPITEVAEAINTSHNSVWGVYQGKKQASLEMVSFLEESYTKKLGEVERIVDYLDQLASRDVIYDKIVSLRIRPFSGKVYGLTVPGLQNYVAGFGACGINHNTFPLPEAQADRFLLKIRVEYPTFTEEMEIVDRYAETLKSVDLKPVLKKDMLMQLQGLVRQVPIANDVKKYAVDLVTKTRNRRDLVEYGASPRASIGLILAAKAHALIEGRKYVSKEDINHMALPILRHRIILSFEAERNNLKEDDVIKGLLK